MNSLEIEYRKASIYLENNDTLLAWITLNSIPSSFSLTTEQSDTHQKYEDLMAILTEIKIQGGSALILDSAQITGLLDIYDDNTLPGIYARNMLVIASYLNYQEPYLFPDNLKKMEVKPLPAGIEMASASISAFPNPSAYYTIVEYDLSNAGIQEGSAVSIIIRDIRGITQKTLVSIHEKDQLVLDVRGLQPGLYFVDLLCHGERMTTTKLLVDR